MRYGILYSNSSFCCLFTKKGVYYPQRGCGLPYAITASVWIGQKEIHLTQTEYNIVALLSENHGKMMTYAAIIKAIWGGSALEGSIKKLQVNMANIRKKFGDKPGEANYIANELGVGYRLNE